MKKNKLNPNKLYHLSQTPISKLSEVKFVDEKEYYDEENIKNDKYFYAPITSSNKPVGFWYSIGSHWLKNEASKNCCYLYEVVLDPKIKLLKLNTPDKVEAFIAQYYPNRLISFVKDSIFGGQSVAKYNWGEISEKYDGVEFAPYFKKINNKFIFELYPKEHMYQAVDIPSGVLWNPKKTKLRLVKKLKK